jgi:hypothetical protein
MSDILIVLPPSLEYARGRAERLKGKDENQEKQGISAAGIAHRAGMGDTVLEQEFLPCVFFAGK